MARASNSTVEAHFAQNVRGRSLNFAGLFLESARVSINRGINNETPAKSPPQHRSDAPAPALVGNPTAFNNNRGGRLGPSGTGRISALSLGSRRKFSRPRPSSPSTSGALSEPNHGKLCPPPANSLARVPLDYIDHVSLVISPFAVIALFKRSRPLLWFF